MQLPLQPGVLADATLVARTLAGDRSAFDYLVERHEVAVRSYVRCRLRDPAGVDDIAQETFILAFRRLADFDPARPLIPWLRGIAFNLLRNHRRSGARTTTTDEIEDFFVEETEGSSRHEDEAVDALRECLAGLSPESRELIHRRYTENLPVSEICKITGQKHSATTMALHRVRTRLEECVSKKLPAWRRVEAS